MRGNEENIIRKKIKKRFHYEQKLSLWNEIFNLRKRHKKEKIVLRLTKNRFS